MAYEGNLQCIPGVVAAGDLSSHQFKFMKIDTNGEVALNTTAGAFVAGVLQNKPTAQGAAASVAYDGVSKVVAGSNVTKGDPVRSDVDGKAVKNNGAVAPGYFTRGIALETGVQDDLISVQLSPTGYLHSA
jgi:hypothetical protein